MKTALGSTSSNLKMGNLISQRKGEGWGRDGRNNGCKLTKPDENYIYIDLGGPTKSEPSQTAQNQCERKKKKNHKRRQRK